MTVHANHYATPSFFEERLIINETLATQNEAKMPVQVLPAEDADMTRIYEVASRAFTETKDPSNLSFKP